VHLWILFGSHNKNTKHQTVLCNEEYMLSVRHNFTFKYKY